MIIGACEVHLYLPEVTSLKEKRRIIKSLLARLRNKFNVATAEVDLNDVWQSAVIGIVTISNSSSHVNQSFDRIIAWIEDNYPQVIMTQKEIEIL